MFPRPVVVRRRRPLLRTAIIGGGAYAAGRAAANRANARAESEPPAAPPTAAVPAQAGAQPDMLAQLTQLTELHEKGALSDDEFAAAKSKLLGASQ